VQFADHQQSDELVAFSLELADVARDLLGNWRAQSGYEIKEDSSPVTDLDRGIETRIRDLIRTRYPQHGIIGEEFPSESPNSEFVWIVDPIDGTKSFTAGIPVFTTLIALCRHDVPVIGIIDAIATDSRWLGVEGRPTTENGVSVRTSGRTRLEDSTLSWSDPQVVLEEHRAGQKFLQTHTAWRIAGGDAYGYGRVASGGLDIAVDSDRVLVSDICAFAPIIKGAGGECTDGFGAQITLHSQLSCVAAATPELHSKVIEALNTRWTNLVGRDAMRSEPDPGSPTNDVLQNQSLHS
jgi:histidinol phosphatase-like enzyme (inositol monophosphatase family)